MSLLERIVSSSVAELVGPDRQTIALDGRPLAHIGAPNAVTALVSRCGTPGAIVDLVAMLISPRPSGLLVFGDGAGSGGLALWLRDGIVTAVTGPGPFGTLGAFLVEFHQRRLRLIHELGEGAAAIDPCRGFALETALRQLSSYDSPDATILWLSGQMRSLGEELPAGSQFEASFLLLELARRTDEMPGLEAKIGQPDQVVVPVSRPGARADRPAPRPHLRAASEVDEDEDEDEDSNWDFFDDPDPAAEAEWMDARAVFESCDGVTTVDGLAAATMLSRFRVASALVALLDRGHVALMPSVEGGNEIGDLIQALGDVA